MDNLRGALLMILAMAGFAGEDAFIKNVTARIPIGEAIIYLGALGGFGFAILANRAGSCFFSRTFFHRAVLLRNGSEILGTAAYVTSITLLPLSLAAALIMATPLFVTLGAILFLGARVGWQRWLAIALGLVGVLIILRPGFEGFRIEALFGLLAAFFLAARDLATRACPPHAHPLQLSSWAFVTLVPVGAVMLWMSGGAVRPTGAELGLLTGALVLGMSGYYALTLSMQVGEIPVVTPFRYTRLVFAIALGWVFFSERPDTVTLVGAGLIVTTGIYTLWRERRAMRRG